MTTNPPEDRQRYAIAGAVLDALHEIGDAPSPLDQLAAWLEKQTRNHPGVLAVNPYTVSIYHYTRYDEGDRNQYRVAIEKHDDHYEQAGGDTINEAAAKLLDQLKDKP